MFTPYIPFLECEIYTKYPLLVGSANNLLREIGQYEPCRQECSCLFQTSESVLPLLEKFLRDKALEGRMRQTMVGCNIGRSDA